MLKEGDEIEINYLCDLRGNQLICPVLVKQCEGALKDVKLVTFDLKVSLIQRMWIDRQIDGQVRMGEHLRESLRKIRCSLSCC